MTIYLEVSFQCMSRKATSNYFDSELKPLI